MELNTPASAEVIRMLGLCSHAQQCDKIS